MSLIIFLSEIRGEINAALTIIPASIMSLEISATRLMFSNLSSWLNPSSLLIPLLILSPSRVYEL